MSDLNPSRLGQINATGNTDALFLKVWSGEVIAAFHESNVMMPLHMVRTIESGRSAQFPVTGVVTAEYHIPGTELVGTAVKHGEREIFIDDLLVAHTFLAKIDEAKNHYEVRSTYTAEMGKVLAETADKQLARLAVLAARAAATISGGDGGTVVNTITNAANTNVTELLAAIWTSAQKLDEKKVPKGDRFALVRPVDFYKLIQDRTALNRDWSGAGSYSQGALPEIGGVKIVSTIHVPTTNVAAVSGEKNTYNGDFTKTVACVFHRSAIGTVKLLDLATEMEYSARHQGTFMVSKYAMGHGILRPEASVEICQP